MFLYFIYFDFYYNFLRFGNFMFYGLKILGVENWETSKAVSDRLKHFQALHSNICILVNLYNKMDTLFRNLLSSVIFLLQEMVLYKKSFPTTIPKYWYSSKFRKLKNKFTILNNSTLMTHPLHKIPFPFHSNIHLTYFFYI